MANGDAVRVDWRAVGLILFLVTHLGTALWFGSQLNTQVQVIQEDVRDLAISFRGVERAISIRAEEAARRDERQQQLKSRIERLEGKHP